METTLCGLLKDLDDSFFELIHSYRDVTSMNASRIVFPEACNPLCRNKKMSKQILKYLCILETHGTSDGVLGSIMEFSSVDVFEDHS